MTPDLFIALGGNLPSRAGPPRETLVAALGELERAGLQILKRSSWYATAPVPASDQPWFVNGVAQIATTLEPEPLLELLHRVEASFGRERGAANAARTLDLDLLAYGGLVRNASPPLLPHPRLQDRGFVLAPLAEIAPDWSHPVLGLTAHTLLKRLGPGPEVTILPKTGVTGP